MDVLLMDAAARQALATREATRCVEHLLGLVEGIVADGHLHDREVQLLSTWLAENRAICDRWPASALHRIVRSTLEDGVITDAERTHLMDNLQALVGNKFSITGSASPEVASLPIEDAVTVTLRNAGICHTGDFLFGTRAACERLSLSAGATCFDTVTKKVDYLVIGTRVSSHWAHTSFGRKIQKAVELQDDGVQIEIISERRWLEAAGVA